jgi:hypothetical protein
VALRQVEHVVRLCVPARDERAHVQRFGRHARIVPRLDRMEKPRPRIFDMGTKNPRPSRPTISGGWNPTEED